nr:unnamed protein product [Spirometra erinaceieuropaei]
MLGNHAVCRLIVAADVKFTVETSKEETATTLSSSSSLPVTPPSDWQDNPRSNRPERRASLVARELARNKMDIPEPSKTRLSEQGQLEEVGAGYPDDIVEQLLCLP